jgi:GNAT superfamily N-acetyltransferase
MIELKSAQSENDYAIAKELFLEYASQLGVDLGFQNFDKEVETIKSEYALPEGALFIGFDREQNPIGCFAVRKFKDSVCELKRMYLQPRMQGHGAGSVMLKKAIAVAKELGYERMRLDTLPTMQAAINLYRKNGFYEIPPYRFNPIEGTKYFEIRLMLDNL